MRMQLDIDMNHIIQAIDRLPDKLGLKVTRNAVKAGANVIAKRARRLAPFNPNRKTGLHIREVIVVKRLDGTNDIMRIGVKYGRGGAPHAHLLEYGTVKMSPRPFMRPAAEQTLTEISQKITTILDRGVNRELEKLAGRR